MTINIITLISIIQVALPTLVIGLAFYVMIYRPQKNYRLTTDHIATNLQPGSKIITSAGIQGTVMYILANTLIIQTQDGQKIEILKQTITDIQP